MKNHFPVINVTTEQLDLALLYNTNYLDILIKDHLPAINVTTEVFDVAILTNTN